MQSAHLPFLKIHQAEQFSSHPIEASDQRHWPFFVPDNEGHRVNISSRGKDWRQGKSRRA